MEQERCPHDARRHLAHRRARRPGRRVAARAWRPRRRARRALRNDGSVRNAPQPYAWAGL